MYTCACPLYLCVFVFVCLELEAREPAIKKRIGTSKGLEAQTQHTCWQSIGKPGEVKLERAREQEKKRGKKEEGRVSACGRDGENQREEGGFRRSQRTHTLSSAFSLV